jgi:hypothetical protein
VQWALAKFLPAPAFLVHEAARAEELAERRSALTADHAGLKVGEHRAGHVLAAIAIELKHVDAVELCVIVAAVLAAAADVVLVAYHLQILGAHLATALVRLHVHNLARRNNLEAGRTREKKAGRSGET